MQIGLFGFPLTGKSTLFQLLTGASAHTHGARGEAQVGVTKIPDSRLVRLAEMIQPKRVTPATIEYMDIAGVEKGEAADALPLEKLRTADALAHVVRAFRDDSIPHVEGAVDPARDVDTMETELLIADHTIAQRRVKKLELAVKKAHQEEDRHELEVMKKCLESLEGEVPLRNLEFSEDDEKLLRGFTFLTLKPLLIVVNADEADASRLDAGTEAFGLADAAAKPKTDVVAMSAKIEAEIAQLDPEDAAAFRADLGIAEPALDRMIRASYRHLGRITFFTTSGEKECRAWALREGMTAHEAAGVVHTDMQRGFIRAEVVGFDDLMEAGSFAACRDRGTMRLEGKDYVVQDGDVVHIRFNV